jgi:hypothetical protein
MWSGLFPAEDPQKTHTTGSLLDMMISTWRWFWLVRSRQEGKETWTQKIERRIEGKVVRASMEQAVLIFSVTLRFA